MKFAPLRTGNADLDRVQDGLTRAMRALGKRLDVYKSSPPASADNALTPVIVAAPGEPVSVRICLPKTTGGYEWVTIATGS